MKPTLAHHRRLPRALPFNQLASDPMLHRPGSYLGLDALAEAAAVRMATVLPFPGAGVGDAAGTAAGAAAATIGAAGGTVDVGAFCLGVSGSGPGMTSTLAPNPTISKTVFTSDDRMRMQPKLAGCPR